MSYHIQKISADLVLTLNSPPIKNGIVVLGDKNLIIDVLDPLKLDYTPDDVLHYNGIVIPGFVNAHCHLELSWQKGMIGEHTGLDRFIRDLTFNNEQTVPEFREEKAAQADQQMFNSGIVAALDITDSIDLWQLKKESSVYYHQSIEVFGSDPDSSETIMQSAVDKYRKLREHFPCEQLSISPHSTYSVSDQLLKLISEHALQSNHLISIHHLENSDELDYFLTGTGKITGRQKFFNVGNTTEFPKGKRPVLALSSLLPSKGRILFVHNTIANNEDLEFIGQNFRDPWFCFCPNANLYIENTLPQLTLFSDFSKHLTIGTDSLASNHCLSIIEEMKVLQEKGGITDLEEMLNWACLNGAKLLGIESWAGSIEKGKAPGLALLENTDIENMLLTNETTSKLITRHLP